MRSSPSPAFNDPARQNYNLRWGPVTGRLSGSLQTEYNDNINLGADHRLWDISLMPNVGVGFQWPISPRNVLQFDIGFGYHTSVNHPELDSFSVSPDSKLIYQMRAGKVNLTFRDSFSVNVDPLIRPDVSGGNSGSLLNFKRVNNDFGIQSEWQARSNLAIVSSYDYTIDRSLNHQFAALDRDDHNLSLGGFSNIGAIWNVGVSGATTISDFVEPIQNDGISYSIGPQVSVKVTHFITVDATVAYTHSEFDQSGTIADRSSFSGASFSVGVRHTINSRMNESIRTGRSISPGFGSNFNELTTAQYGLTWKFTPSLSLNGTFSYEHLIASGPSGEVADRFLTYIGTGWQIAKRWDIGVGYSFAWKDSDQNIRDYRQNRVSVNLTHAF